VTGHYDTASSGQSLCGSRVDIDLLMKDKIIVRLTLSILMTGG
jgi:hypothetical protein